MNISKDELLAVLAQFNPWWRQEALPELPLWQRSSFKEVLAWVVNPPAHRALMLSGARQIGKTTLLLQVIQALLQQKIPAANILYVTLDHPILKLVGIDKIIEVWREYETKASGPEFLFLDEGQFIRDVGTWIKHQVDFNKQRRIVMTGSAMPILEVGQESGVGRWHTLRMNTLSFFEYLQLKKVELTPLPKLNSLEELFTWPKENFLHASQLAQTYIGHFHEYLVRGGFPQTALIESINQAQRLLREDIVDRVLKRDMTAIFGVRRILDLEHTFLYLCMHDGGLLDMPDLCGNLEVKRPTAQHFIELLESAHLIYRLPPFGYGKEILRAHYKIYLADAAIAPAVMLKGKSMIEDPQALSIAAETAVFKHLIASYGHEARFSYWRGNKEWEVDIIMQKGEIIIPLEVKYRAQHTGVRELKGLKELCEKKTIEQGYVITKSASDFGFMPSFSRTKILQLPAAILCYYLGLFETFSLQDE